ncbi:MAG TPA: hypothetical protein VNC13_03500, partial [Propionibacteriaceae bacterium]|nr:hypothetical protein [Propionibacteriaceae bacterium]
KAEFVLFSGLRGHKTPPSWLGVVDDDWGVHYPFAANRTGHAGERDRGPRTWRPVREVVIAILQ